MSSVTLTVLCGTSLLGAIAGTIGAWSVLRRQALAGDLISHAALPGICLAYWFTGERDYGTLLIGAMTTGLLSVLLVSYLTRRTRTKDDAAIGIVLSVFFSLGVVGLSLIQRDPRLSRQSAGLATFALGQAANLSTGDLWWIGGVGGTALAIMLLCYKEFKLLSFDVNFARSLGLPILTLDIALMTCLAAVTVIGIKAAGVLLSPALLIIPAVTARLWVDQLGKLLWLAAAIGAVMGCLGTLLTAGEGQAWLAARGWYTPPELPTGPVIVLCGAVAFGLSLLLAPQNGVFARYLRQTQYQHRIARENFLRALYELHERQPPRQQTWSRKELLEWHSWDTSGLERQIALALQRGDLRENAAGVAFTEEGLRNAQSVTRAHRLWELFLIQGANIARDHVDRDADGIEHLLSPELLAELESELRAAGRWPVHDPVPASPHAVQS
ncbi:MAG: iron chelate uptake ABC transporter family permease subunit [Pirellulales bacterium]|nr:iron chelate uptake ABC transporter family permease subunit [Pirellulales bacterium]